MPIRLLLAGLVLALLTLDTSGAEPAGVRRGPDFANGPRHVPPPFTEPGNVDVILGRPTGNSIVLSVLRSDRDGAAYLAYGTQAGKPDKRTPESNFRLGQPQEIPLTGLAPDQAYGYELHEAGSGKLLVSGQFHTLRPAGATFTFTITADSHLDQNTDPAVYRRTLANAAADHPDFHIDLGDTSMSGKFDNRTGAANQYRAQRFYLGELGRTAPLFLVVGNHDGEEARSRRGADSLAAWANQMRKRYFPNPVPDGFYSGDSAPDPQAGLLQDYYAWTWGDALFVVLNPYWHANSQRGEEGWELSLGTEQYRWLSATLAGSKARWKFVFVHQLVGGLGRQGRGGVEAAGFGEWGGLNADGSPGFAAHRPGWAMPVHELLVRNRVTMVLHGHDHLFAAQELDGIVYQEVPQPGHPGDRLPHETEEYGYKSGTILGGSGHMRFRVGTDAVRAEFVRSEGRVAHGYVIRPR